MSSIDGIDRSTLDALGLAREQNQTSPSNDLGQDDFMTLMLAQLKNQDPMSPMENNEFLAQIAQFNTVTGIQEMQKSFEQLVTSQQSNQALQASSLVGRSVLVPSDSATLTDGESVEGMANLTSSTSELRIGVMDGSGQIVRTMNLGSQPEGHVKFTWDGRADDGSALPPGTYGFVAEARSGEGVVGVETLMSARVESVTLGRNGSAPALNLQGAGSIELSRVREVM